LRSAGYSLDDLFDEYAKREGLERHDERTENDPTKSQYDFAKLQQFYPSGDDGSGWTDLHPYNEVSTLESSPESRDQPKGP